ncbi:conserved hypothetical protein [Ricinus communis]|uniref:Uncharacterized protein n=1 Tax=Ricinus communis TaxID=3988 RepID=B9SUX7_RICCO|nr:conserved hypothetical protein [Ricinus communis]
MQIESLPATMATKSKAAENAIQDHLLDAFDARSPNMQLFSSKISIVLLKNSLQEVAPTRLHHSIPATAGARDASSRCHLSHFSGEETLSSSYYRFGEAVGGGSLLRWLE